MAWQTLALLVLVTMISQPASSLDTSTDVDSDTNTNMNNSNAFTFQSPGKSYVEYHTSWSDIHDIQLDFTFRTFTTNTMLLHHTFLETESEYRPELKVLLIMGALEVEHRYGDIIERLPVAKGMSHDKWHHMKVVLSIDGKDVRAQVGDRPERSKVLKALLDPKAQQAYRNDKRTSVIFIGGFSPESVQQPSAFVGCIKDVSVSDGVTVMTTHVHSKSDVQEGCLSACDTQNQCLNDGKCVNLYTSVQCDCFQTGHHGENCEKQGLTTVTLAGDEWIRYNLYEDVESERSHMPGIRIAMDFRTSISEGVLFYASETQPQYNHLAVSLFNGTLHISVVFEDRDTHSELYTTIGKDLHDGRWHSLIVIHDGKDVKLQLDNDYGDMEAKHSHPHLNLPEMIYYAGIEQGYPGIGLRSQQTFIGCVRNLYFNHIAVLDHLDERAYYHGSSPLEYKCQDVHTTSMQYRHDGSYIRILSEQKKDLSVQFEFRTYKPNTLLFHADMGTHDYKGYIKGYLVGGKFELHIVPSGYHSDERQVLTLGYKLNKAEWHSIKAYYRSGMVQIWVDEKFTIQPVKWELSVGKATYFGYAPDIFDEKKSYIGCMRHLEVQDQHIDPLPLIKSENSVGVSIGSCDLTDWCADENPCLNKGLCVSEWLTSFCDCGHTYYEGSNCQFSLLKRSCEEYFLTGDRNSGVRRVDIDGTGPIKPMHVYCELGVVVNGRKYGMTQVEHNLKPETKFRGANMKDMRKELQYRDMGKSVLSALVNSSAYCRQHLSLNCYRAFLGLGKETKFTSASNHEFSHVGGNTEGTCACDAEDSCLDDRHACNCDMKLGKWVSDAAYLDNKQEVPVTELTFLQQFGGKANVTLGPLECMGKDTQSEDHVVMFTTESSILDVDGWKGGSIEFIFRTLKAPCTLLYQHGQGASDTQLSVNLISDNKIVIKTGQPPVDLELNTSQKLTSGEWHLLQIHIGNDQLRASIAGQKKIVNLPKGVEGPGIYSNRLYIGDKPMKHESDMPGMIGCLGGLTFNGKHHPLAKLVKENKFDVEGLVKGCATKCEAEPCQNDAVCLEKWDSYECECSNKYAHSGETCENNVNTNSVKFVSSGRYLEFLESEVDVLGSDYYVSVRTNQKKALLLYVHDENNNFIQMDIEDGEVFHLSYNSGYDIQHATVKVSGLTDGRWKQVAILSGQGLLRLDVDGVVKEYKDERMPLMTYSQVPYKALESVVPMRNLHAPSAGTRIYVGGVPNSFIGFDGLKGCIRGLMIDELLVDMSGAAQDRNGFLPGCPSGCETEPCQNGGRCLDDIDFNDAYTCDCSRTGMADMHCDGEVGAYFKGSTMEESLRGKHNGEAMIGEEEARLELAFATSAPVKKTAIGFVRGKTGLSDYMLLYLTTVDLKVCVAADVQVQDTTVSVVGDKHTGDGKPHRVVLERHGHKVTLQVDGTTHEADFEETITKSYDTVAILDVGWVRKDNFRFGEFANFTGDIWNVFFTSDMLGVVNARPIEVYNGYDDGNYGVHTAGIIAPVTQSLNGLNYGYMYSDQVWNEGDNSAYPPWNPVAAKTVQLNTAEDDVAAAGASPAIAFMVCGIALVFFLGLTLFLVLRHRRRNKRSSGSFTSKSTDDQTDEEEGLLRKINPNIISGLEEEEEHIATAKLRRGPKKGKSGSGAEDEENEETPMLQSEAPMAETGPGENIPMETFDQQIREMSAVEEITGVDLEQTPPVPPKTSDSEETVEDSEPQVSQGPPKPPRTSSGEISQESTPAEEPSPEISNEVKPNSSESSEPATDSSQINSKTDDQSTPQDAATTPRPDEESGDEREPDIEIKAEVYKEPQPGDNKDADTGSNHNTPGESSPAASSGTSFSDEITEISGDDADSSDKTGSKKARRNKQKSKH